VTLFIFYRLIGNYYVKDGLKLIEVLLLTKVKFVWLIFYLF